jgi:HSP20 family protein
MAISDLIPWNWGEKKVPVKRTEESDPIRQLQYGMNRLFSEFFDSFELSPFGTFGGSLGVFNPQIDVVENDQEYKVTAELPGLAEKDIQVSLDRNVLTISGEKKAEKESKGDNFYHMERAYGSFRRTIPLPGEVNPEQIDATFKKGVLKITLPKLSGAQAKRISVRTTG